MLFQGIIAFYSFKSLALQTKTKLTNETHSRIQIEEF